MEEQSYIKGIIHGVSTLLIGMKTTIKEFFTKKVTEQYPENRATLEISPRFRGMLVMPSDENGNNKCVACGLCEQVCPYEAVKLVEKKVPFRGLITVAEVDPGKCMACGMCTAACRSTSIRLNQDFNDAEIVQNLWTWLESEARA